MVDDSTAKNREELHETSLSRTTSKFKQFKW